MDMTGIEWDSARPSHGALRGKHHRVYWGYKTQCLVPRYTYNAWPPFDRVQLVYNYNNYGAWYL